LLSFVRAVPARRRPRSLTDRFFGVSRRRRQAGYAALAAGYALLRPALRRLVGTSVVVVFVLAAVVAVRF
jgi:hypothetical protein